ncbi:MAG: ROK family protein [Bacteroidota bacterium]
MDFLNDERVVMTLDAGGTNFVFNAIQGLKEVAEPVIMPSSGNDLHVCLNTITKGFEEIRNRIPGKKPVAISFAFPGPADYPNGIIGDLGNLPSFRGGVPLGPMLEDKFNVPVYINNDGNLFAYGESIAGFLPYINNLLSGSGISKRYRNLIGITLGTGFGAGIVIDGHMIIGDNSNAAEVWLLSNRYHSGINAEETISIRALRNNYETFSGNDMKVSPEDIYKIGTGSKAGDQKAAIRAFHEMGKNLGDAIANMLTIIDGLVVIGGGISGAGQLFMPSLMEELNKNFRINDNGSIPRLAQKVFNIDNKKDQEDFLKSSDCSITVPGSAKNISYDPAMRTAIGISSLGTSKAVFIGAYAYALSRLNKKS